MKPTLQQAFADNKGLLVNLWKYFHRGFCDDKEDCIQEIHMAFIEGYNSYNPERGVKLTTHLYNFTKNKMLHILRHRRKWRKEWSDAPCIDFLQRNSFSLDTLLLEISEEAQTVVKLALEKENMKPCKIKETLKELLRDLGWSGSQIMSVFSEIMRALR